MERHENSNTDYTLDKEVGLSRTPDPGGEIYLCEGLRSPNALVCDGIMNTLQHEIQIMRRHLYQKM